MSVHLRHRRPLLISALMVITLFVSIAPVTAAQSAGNYDWFGWGVNVDFQNNTWNVRYVTYLGVNLPSPRIVKEVVADISAECRERSRNPQSQLTYPTTDSARFDGNVYLECALPSVRDDLLELGYTPPEDGPFCICTLGGAPFWVDGQIRHLTTSGTMPLLDASDRGVRVNLLVNGTKARTKLDVTRAQPQGGVVTYTSPEWTVDAAGNRTMMGWHGKKIVAVADHYHWLDYLADTRWRPFFQTQVSGSTIGSWNESSTTTIRDKQTRAGNYQMGMNAGTLYIGYSPSTNQYFTGDIERVGGDPGCDGT